MKSVKKRGSNGIFKITPRVVNQVKKLLEQFSPLPPKHSERPIGALSLRDIARISKVSFYTVWAIKEGKYDTESPLVEKDNGTGFFNVDEHCDWLIGGPKIVAA